ncbi:MAG: hypothetical protein OEM41_02615 [Ignavibacteria bacterium]|nr:hypothetical protein [Ignavibacteria bacterium]
MKPSNPVVLFVLLALLLASCSDSATGPENGATVTLNLLSAPAPAKEASTAVVLQSAKVLLKHVRFQHESSNDSLDVKTGIVAVELSLSGGSTEFAVAPVTVGIYDQVRFRLHKPEDTEPIPDPEFREGAGGDQRYSVIVRGTYNGTPFVYKSRQNAEQRINIAPALTVVSGEPVNVTLLVDPAMWFMNGGTAIDPTDQQNADHIDNQIRASFRSAFRDNNKDGNPD